MEIKCKEKFIEILQSLNQNHIIQEFQKRNKDEQDEFIKQVEHLQKIYPGGLAEYIKRAKVLLSNSKNNVNPYSDYSPSVPDGEKINISEKEFSEFEKIGLEQIRYTGFVLVAGGLGERLGYNDIKVGIPMDLITGTCYLKYYIDHLRAYEDRFEGKVQVPLCVMTSDDTHEKTLVLLEKNNYFGLKKDQITIVKQEKVPALLDNDCNFSILHDKFLIDTKPHGHGDVHTLLHQNRVIENWKNQGKKWVVFFQDTNALVFRAVPSALGVSSSKKYVVNSITVPRRPGEAVGAICKLSNEKTKQTITLNVEYNQLDSLLREKWNKEGDIKNDQGLSHFPGNINVLVFELDSYYDVLNETKGLMPEFVNPKYADESKNKFKSPTRLECMMQDYPQLLKKNEKVGFTMYERWFCFSPCKNNLQEAVDKIKKGLFAESGFSVEQDIFSHNTKILKEMGCIEVLESNTNETVEVLDVKLDFWPKIFINPSFAVTLEELKSKFSGKNTISKNSTVIFNGKNAHLENVKIDGLITVNEGTLSNAKLENNIRLCFVPLKKDEGENFEQIRGYRLMVKNFN